MDFFHNDVVNIDRTFILLFEVDSIIHSILSYYLSLLSIHIILLVLYKVGWNILFFTYSLIVSKTSFCRLPILQC